VRVIEDEYIGRRVSRITSVITKQRQEGEKRESGMINSNDYILILTKREEEEEEEEACPAI